MTYAPLPIPLALTKLLDQLDDDGQLFYAFSQEEEPGFRFLSASSVSHFTGHTQDECLKDPGLVFDAVALTSRSVLRTMLTTPAGAALIEEPLMIEWAPADRAPFWADHQGICYSETLACGVFRDRSREMEALKNLAQALQQSRACAKSAIEAIPGPALLVSPEGIVTASNRSSILFFGPGSVGRPLKAILDGEPRAQVSALILKAMSTDEASEIEVAHGGRTLRFRAYPVVGDRGEVVAVSLCADDITQIQVLKDQLARADRLESLRVLAGGIAHGFNNILGIMVSYGEIARARAKSLEDPELMGLLDEIVSAGVRGRDLVRQATVFTAARKSSVSGEPIDPGLIVSGILRELRTHLPESITLTRRIESHTGLTEAGPEAIYRIVNALIEAALSAMEEGGGELNVIVEPEVVTLRGVPATSCVTIQVSDTGPASAPRFLSEETSALLDATGGEIAIEPLTPQGARVRVLLPRHRVKSEVKLHEFWGKRRRILVVDDDPSVLSGTVRLIELLGLSATGVSEAGEALERFSDELFDLVVTDYSMPDMNGIELVKRLRAIRPIAAVLYTGHGELLSGLETDNLEVLTKPVLAHELSAVLDRLFGRLVS